MKSKHFMSFSVKCEKDAWPLAPSYAHSHGEAVTFFSEMLFADRYSRYRLERDAFW